MARVEHLVLAPPHAVFAVLCDGDRYDAWVVGAKRIREVEPDWPQVGSVFHHRVGVGPLRSEDTSQVLALETDHRMALDVRFRPFGTARVELLLEPVPDGTVVVMREEATSGFLRVLPDAWSDALLDLRNAASLRRLEGLVLGGPAASTPTATVRRSVRDLLRRGCSPAGGRRVRRRALRACGG